ncbi:hypothetical protein [Aquimarina spongiae]|uniref:Secreted protein n=1 Tax=Aquimarina spongiae TaxID=570521 RepID=A0A1M6I7Y2_9FLAO|nr:hypothetical protein [Aquimarina spongiae]SHJ30473.1 hypothetical protein SAMN04488508_107168 [Aquimarina spongiae]
MKTILYTLVALFMIGSFTSCTTDSVADEDVSFEYYSTTGENGQMGGEDEG